MALKDRIDIGQNQISKALVKLQGNIKNGIMASLGQAAKSGSRYPEEIGSGVTVKSITNQPDFQSGGWRSSPGYAFQVYRVDPGSSLTKGITRDKNGKNNWQEFRLQINPQELTQDEIFAIEVTPTFRGVVVEHHGQILKDITISGTTGKSPKARDGGVVPATGRPVLASGHSGYEEFHELRSYIRAYVEAKRVDKRDGGELRLVFKNFKDEEYLFVEPQKFTMKRSSEKSILYNYTIQLKAIGVANGPTKPSGDNYGIIGDVAAVLNKATTLINYASNTISAASGIVRRFEQDLVNTILGPTNALLALTRQVQSGQFTKLTATRKSVEALRLEYDRVGNNVADGIGIDMTEYNAAAGRTSTLSGTPGRQPTYSEFQALNGFQAGRRGLAVLLSENKLFEEDAGAQNATVENIYEGKISIPRATSVRSVQIDGSDTIQTLAARELGDPDRFREIALLNNLKAPYIDSIGGEGVLTPGQNIFLPQQSSQQSTGVKRNKEFNITRLLSETEKALGVDIRLDRNNDLAVSNTNDLDLVAGIDNMSQAILVRLNLEPGSLKRHQSIGVGFNIGEKATSDRLSEMRRNIIASFGSDLRIDSVPFIELLQVGNTTRINLVLKIKDLDLPVPLPITVTGAA